MTPYILWDWNGTLLDDTDAAVEVLNAMLARRGKPPITKAFYRDHFGFPVKPFYTTIGIVLENEDWDAIAREYHETYHRQSKGLNCEACAALEMIRRAGGRQSIISALRQDLLDRDTAAANIREHMEFIVGTDNLDGGSKMERAHDLLDRIRRAHPKGDFAFTLIGDSLHDKEVADALGVGCVLCAQGSHADWRLRRVAPTFATLLDAVRFCMGDGGGEF